MHERYKNQVEDVGLFGAGVCEVCGKPGFHSSCEERQIEVERKFHESEVLFLQQYALHGAFGAFGIASQETLDLAIGALQSYLGRPLECDLTETIEGDSWWYLPEGWIGMIGFVVEKKSFAIYPLGSGLVGISRLKYARAHWCGIVAYINGGVEAVIRSEH